MGGPAQWPSLDTTVPALVLKSARNPLHHGTLGIIRTLGRLGVPVYAVAEDRFTPAGVSRYLTSSFPWKTSGLCTESFVERLVAIAARIGCRAILIPTDDRAAAFVAEHADALTPWYRFPRLPRDLPRLLANKRDLHMLCRSLDVPSPEMAVPGTLDDVHAFIERARFPAVVKAADSHAIPNGGRSTSIVRSPAELLAIYRQATSPERRNLMFQEYIPASGAEDWVFHGYSNPQTGCFVAFTGKKVRSYPPFAGPTSLGVSFANETLSEQTLKLVKATGYAGIMDLDYRLDKRDGLYKLLDFNPRVGANFRMFENLEGVDVVRALHLDLTGRRVPQAQMIKGRKFILESHDWFASLSYFRRGSLKFNGWLHSMSGKRELAWFSPDDPLPVFFVCLRLIGRIVKRALRATARYRLV